MNDRLRLDLGLRLDREHINTSFGNSDTANLHGSSIADGSTALALTSVGNLNGTYSTYSPTFKAHSWSIGADYKLSDNFATFARYSQTQRLPRTEDGWVAGNRALQLTQS